MVKAINPKDEKELKEIAQARGKKLGWLISQLFIKQEEKQAMLAMVEKMNVEQLDKLVETLEQKYLEAQTKPLDEVYQKSLRQVQSDYINKHARLNQDTINKLKDLEQRVINQASR